MERNTSTLSLIPVLEEVGGQRHAPAALTGEIDSVSILQKAGWTQGRPGRARKTRPPPTGIRSPDRPARTDSLYRLYYPDKGQDFPQASRPTLGTTQPPVQWAPGPVPGGKATG
jgi:hypothetical protein